MRRRVAAHRFTGSSVRSFRSSLRVFAIIAAAFAVSALHSDRAIASIPDAAGVFHGCIKKGESNLRIIDSDKGTCNSNETEITWSKQGPPGQIGAQGTPGPTGPSDAYVKDQRNSFGAITISTTTLTPILTLPSLPAGNYVVFASAAISGPNTFASTSCSLVSGAGSPLSSGFQASTGGGSGFTFAVIPVIASFTLTQTVDVNLSCRTSSTDVVSQPSVITAIKVGALH